MYCRSCQTEIWSNRSVLCVGCSSGETLLQDFRADWGSPVLRNIAVDLSLSAARQVRALRLYSLREAVKGGEEEVAARSSGQGHQGEKPESYPTKVDRKEETQRTAAVLKERRTTPGEKQDSLSSSYTSGEEEEEQLRKVKAEASPLPRRGEASRGHFSSQDEKGEPGLSAKSSPPSRPRHLEGRKDSIPEATQEESSRHRKEPEKDTERRKHRHKHHRREHTRSRDRRRDRGEERKSSGEKGQQIEFLDDRLLSLVQEEPEKEKKAPKAQKQKQWRPRL